MEDYTKYRGYILRNGYSQEARYHYQMSDWVLVLDIDYHIGVTIVDLFDKKNYVACTKNPRVIAAKKGAPPFDPDDKVWADYDKLFMMEVEKIKSNVYSTPDEILPPSCTLGSPNANSCAFT